MKEAFFAVLIGVQLVDIASTLYALKLGGVEVNPFLNRLFSWTGKPAVVLVVLKLLFIVLIAWLYDDLHAGVLGMLCVFYAYILYNNYKAIQKLKRRQQSTP